MAKPSKLSVSLIGVVLAGLVMIIFSHVLMGNVDNMTKKDANNKTKKEDSSGQVVTPEHDAIDMIMMRVGDKEFPIILARNDASQEFAEALPFELEMKELNGNEKYYTGRDKFQAIEEYQPGQIKAGDLMLYGDNTVVLFYKTFNSEYSYTRLGWVQNAYELAEVLGDGDVTIDFTKQ